MSYLPICAKIPSLGCEKIWKICVWFVLVVCQIWITTIFFLLFEWFFGKNRSACQSKTHSSIKIYAIVIQKCERTEKKRVIPLSWLNSYSRAVWLFVISANFVLAVLLCQTLICICMLYAVCVCVNLDGIVWHLLFLWLFTTGIVMLINTSIHHQTNKNKKTAVISPPNRNRRREKKSVYIRKRI